MRALEEDLAAAVELNCADWLRLKGRLPWVKLHEDPDVVWIFGGSTYPGNSATLTQFTPATAHRRIGEILERHLTHKVACNWIVGPRSEPADLTRHLKAHGFSCRIHCAGMACALNALGPSLAHPDGVNIALVEVPPSLVPLTTERREKRFEGRRLMSQFRPQVVWHFSASVAGQAVGEATLLAGSESAGIYDVEVLEKFQRRGIGSALIGAALRHAKKLGYRVAVLGATREGSRIYASRGFQEVCKQSFWKYGKMRQL